MAKRITHEMNYDAPVAQVRAMLLDEGFRKTVAEQQHALRSTIEIDGDQVTFGTVQAARGIPSFAKKFVGDEIEVLQKETWSGERADVHITIPGKPGDLKGTATLLPSGEGTVEKVDLEVKVAIPFVGGKVESLIADLITKALEYENRAGRAWLAAR